MVGNPTPAPSNVPPAGALPKMPREEGRSGETSCNFLFPTALVHHAAMEDRRTGEKTHPRRMPPCYILRVLGSTRIFPFPTGPAMSQVLTRHDRRGLRYFRGGDGPSLLLLHGLTGSARSWEKPGRTLAKQYDVILPDLSGFGASTGREEALHLDHDFYVEAHAETIHRLIDDLNVRTLFLGGHGFGGIVALTLLRLFPGLAVEGLVLAATTPNAAPSLSWPYRMANLPGVGGAACWVVAGTRVGLRLLYHAAVQNKPAFPLAEFERHLTPSTITQARRIARRRLAGRQANEQLDVFLTGLDVPTLVLWGDRDPFLPVEAAKRLVDTLPDAALSLCKDTGHFVPEERPDVTAWHVDDFFRKRLDHPSRPVGTRWLSS